MFRMTAPLAQEISELLAHHLREVEAPSGDIIRFMAELDFAGAECFDMAIPKETAPAELMEAASLLLELRLPEDPMIARQLRQRRGVLYFRFLRAAQQALCSNGSETAAAGAIDGDWGSFLKAKWACLRIRGHFALLRAAGIWYTWVRQLKRTESLRKRSRRIIAIRMAVMMA